MNWNEITYWNNNSYGAALRIRKSHARAAMIVLCILTPFTNWMIPFVKRIIRNDITYRYEVQP